MEFIQNELLEMLVTIIWALVGAVSMGISLGILIKFFDWLTPVNEWNQIKNGNIAMGIILASVVISFGMVIATSLLPQEFTLKIKSETLVQKVSVPTLENKVEKNENLEKDTKK